MFQDEDLNIGLKRRIFEDEGRIFDGYIVLKAKYCHTVLYGMRSGIENRKLFIEYSRIQQLEGEQYKEVR